MCHFLNAGKSTEVDFASLGGWPGGRFRTPLMAGGAPRGAAGDLSHGVSRTSHCKVLVSQPAAALTSVAHHPAEPRIYTAALDGVVRCYDLKDAAVGVRAAAHS
eukprot:Skav223810  [mRNA]  locus=scaffold575:744499:745858:- [translate_table: standard]